MNLLPFLGIVCIALSAPQSVPDTPRIPTLDRLEQGYLQRLHSDVEALGKQSRSEEHLPSLFDYRCILHCHCYQSHDSRGTIEEISTAAKSVGIDCIFMSDHPRTDRDVVTRGPHGEVNGVLFVPGSETNGFLVYPGDYKLPDLSVSEQSLCDEVARSSGMIFVCHPEEHKDWGLKNITGMEVYNTHADFNDEKALLKTLQPSGAAGYARLLKVLDNMKAYPREALSAIFDAPRENLAHYDALCKSHVIAAIAGNDSHQNTGFVVTGTADGKYRLTDSLGEEITVLDPAKTPLIALLFGPSVPDRVLFKRQLDPYAISLGYVNTHVLASERTESALRKSLAECRTYVAFDWIADARGTTFTYRSAGTGEASTIGDTCSLSAGAILRFHSPLPAVSRLMKDGAVVSETTGNTLEFAVREPGVYRVESLLKVGGELRGWIYTGAIRVEK